MIQEFDFCEGASSKWTFDVEIEKLRAKIIFLHTEKTKIMRGVVHKLLMERLRPAFLNFIFAFPELAFRDFLLAPHQNIYISAKFI